MNNYDFKESLKGIEEIRSGNVRSGTMKIMMDLNKIYNKCKCTGVSFINNDGMFFGACVYPVDYNVVEFNNKDFKFTNYKIELDSKLFESLYPFTDREIMAIILHEFGHVLMDKETFNSVRDKVDYTIAKTGIVIKYDNSNDVNNIFKIAIAKALSLFGSGKRLERKAEAFADQFAIKAGFGPEISTVIDKLRSYNDKYTTKNNIIDFMVSGALIRELNGRKDKAVKNIERLRDIETRQHLKDLYDKTLNDIMKNAERNRKALFRPMYESANAEIPFTEASFLKHLKYSSIKHLEDDLYEFVLKLNMITDNVEALSILRSINMRINLIEEYINEYTGSLSSAEVLKLRKVQSKYDNLRAQIAKRGRFEKEYSLYIRTKPEDVFSFSSM